MTHKRRARRGTIGLSALILLAIACRNDPATAHIAIMTASTSAQEALQAAIDTTHLEGTPRIAVSREFKQVLPRQHDDDGLAGILNEAYSYAQDPRIVAVVGPAGSRDALTVAPVFREAGLAFVMPTANSPQIAALGPTGLSLAPPLEDEADFIAEFVARRLRATTALLFHESDEWGSGLQRQTAAALWFRDVQVLDAIPVSTWACNQGPGAESPLIRPAGAEAALRRHQPDVVVLATRNPATACLAGVIHRLAPGTPMVSGDGTDVTSGFVTQLGEAAEYLYSVTFWHHDHAPSTGVFADMLADPPSLSQGMTFEATMLLVRAIREAGATREAVLQYLAEASRSGRLMGSADAADSWRDQLGRLLMLHAGVPIGGAMAEVARRTESQRER